MSSPPSTPELLDRLSALTLRDEHRLRRRILQGREPLDRLAAEVERAEQRATRRRASAPHVTYPPELPVSQARDALAEAIAGHQVVVVAGETGSGKTTQLPKICLELGRGIRGTIGHTQPRRLAARTVADRIAEELQTELGTAVGFKVRFTDRSSDDTLVKVMTDGILLAEIQHDRELRQYDTLIIDEAHERSLNIDFLLGYVRRLLPKRPDLKVVITSATIETERFSQHFGDAPVVTVSGRTYPVEVRYRPPDEDTDPVQAVVDAVAELQHEGPGDVLVFLSGEREIRDTADALRRLDLRDTEVLPLYARLSHAEQHRVFERSTGRRVVLATNVAETSLTVPGIRYVVDPGTARISRFSARLKVQRLPIEPVSQASANQRKGRCGRVAEGICVRLYAEDDFLARPAYTDPEIQRTNLASVVLQMTALGLGQVEDFPFVDPPDRRAIRDGVALLHELGAIEETAGAPRLTPLGRRLAQLPLDPRFGRMVLEADRNGCLREVLVIAAGLTVQDPRERPADKQQAADERHARFADPGSDFLAYLRLWEYLQERQEALSSSGFRRLCKAEFLHYLRVREWQDLHGQLARIVADLGLRQNAAPAYPKAVHGALLAGLLSHVGLKDADSKNEYLGARGAKFAVFPGSALFKKPPRWVVAAELVETSRLWGRICARIEPEWVEPLAGHLVARRYSEPRWSRKRGAVVASERVTLYGIPIVVGRTVDYGRIDPEASRELFLRAALVEGDWETRHAFFQANRALLADVEGLEDRARRRDLVVDDQALYDFYDARVPAEVVSARHFDAWWKQARRATPDLLTFPRELVLRRGVDLSDYPGEWAQGDLRLPLAYRFDPGDPADGVTVEVPLAVLPRVDGDDLAWQVPGLRLDLVVALLKSLPKPIRVGFVPVPDTAAAVLQRVRPRSGPLVEVLADELRRMTGVVVPYDAWDWDRVPPHLRMTVRVRDDAGRVVAEGKDLEALRAKAQPAVRQALSSAATDVERSGLTAWVDLPRTFASGTVQGYPALVDEGATAGVRVLATPAEQLAAHRAGVRRLLLLSLPNPLRGVVGRLPKQVKLALPASPYPTVPALLDDCVVAALDSLVDDLPWTEQAFADLRERVRPELPDATYDVVVATADALAAARRVRERGDLPDDVRGQLDRLVRPGFVAVTGRARLRDLPRYVQAIEVRLDRLARDPGRDRLNTQVVQQLEQEYEDVVRRLPPARRADEAVRHVRWMIEELRVQLFAPTMRTAYTVSEKRVLRALDDLVA